MSPMLKIQTRHSLDIENRDDLGEMGCLVVRQKQGHDCVDVEFVDSNVVIHSAVWEYWEDREQSKDPPPPGNKFGAPEPPYQPFDDLPRWGIHEIWS